MQVDSMKFKASVSVKSYFFLEKKEEEEEKYFKISPADIFAQHAKR